MRNVHLENLTPNGFDENNAQRQNVRVAVRNHFYPGSWQLIETTLGIGRQRMSARLCLPRDMFALPAEGGSPAGGSVAYTQFPVLSLHCNWERFCGVHAVSYPSIALQFARSPDGGSVVQTRRDKRAVANKVLRRMIYNRVGQAWRAWRARVGASNEKQRKLFRAGACFMRLQASKAFRTWVDVVEWRREKRLLVLRCALATQGFDRKHAAVCPCQSHNTHASLSSGAPSHPISV